MHLLWYSRDDAFPWYVEHQGVVRCAKDVKFSGEARTDFVTGGRTDLPQGPRGYLMLYGEVELIGEGPVVRAVAPLREDTSEVERIVAQEADTIPPPAA